MNTKKFIKTGDGTSLAYTLNGPEDAPVLLLVNSIATTMQMWDTNINELSKDYRVLRYDMRGHGASDAPDEPYSIDRLGYDAVELLDSLQIDKAHVVGLSLGGLVAQWLAVFAPHKVDKLVLSNTAAHLSPRTQWDELVRQAKDAKDMATFADMFIGNWFPKSMIDANDSRIDIFRGDILAMSKQGLAGAFAAVRDADLHRVISLITNPTLVIAGDQDTVTKPALSNEIANAIASSELVTLQAVHLSNIQLPEDFNSLVLDFLARDSDRASAHPNYSEANKAFVTEMISSKKQLEDYPGRYEEDLIVYEPASLPFGGIYKGIEAFRDFYPKVREYYDFSTFEVLSVHADKNVVFVTIRTRVAATGQPLMLCERIEFKGQKISKVQLFMLDLPAQ